MNASSWSKRHHLLVASRVVQADMKRKLKQSCQIFSELGSKLSASQVCDP
jgi:hypothetical protein